MLKNVIIMLVIVYAIMILSLIISIIMTKVVRKIIDNNNKKDDKILKTAHKLTICVMVLIGVIYFMPIVGMIISAFIDPILMLIMILSLIISAIPVTCLVMIPLTQKVKIKYFEKFVGDESDFVKI